MNFKEFKKAMKKMDEGIKKVKASENTNFWKDERMYYPQTDKSGNAMVIMRFLPQKNPVNPPIITIYRHSFQEKGRWITNECRKTINMTETCPLCKFAGEKWQEDEELGRKYYRSRDRYGVVLIKDDKNNPENNGKVFIYKMPMAIYNKIMAKVSPEIDEEESINVFDFFEGYDLKLKIVQKGGYNNYDLSEFMTKPTPVAETEQKMEQIFNNIYDLDGFRNEIIKKTKSVEELEKIIEEIEGAKPIPKSFVESAKPKKESPAPKDDDDDDDFDFDDIDDDDIEF